MMNCGSNSLSKGLFLPSEVQDQHFRKASMDKSTEAIYLSFAKGNIIAHLQYYQA